MIADVGQSTTMEVAMDNRNGTDRRRLDSPLGVMIVSGLASFAAAVFAYLIAESDAVRLSRTQGVVSADLTPAVVFAVVGVVLIVGAPIVLLVRSIWRRR